MLNADRDRLRDIKTFSQLVKYLRDDLEWPIDRESFEDLTFDYTAEELGLDPANAAKIQEIKQLRPLSSNQPWGVFFVKFEPKRLPVVALRRILRSLVVKKRQTASSSEQTVWSLNDLLFISAYGEDAERQITFAHFAEEPDTGDLPTLRVLGWDQGDTALHLDHVHSELRTKLHWPENGADIETWRQDWSSAFTMPYRVAITTAKDLAERLADLARAIRIRVNAVLSLESTEGPLRSLMKSFKEALIHDLEPDDFADMYAQTISYGLLAARVSRPMALTADNVKDMIPITSPFLKELLESFLTVGGRKNIIDFDELGVNDVVDLLRNVKMEAVLRDFDNRNPQEDPVIHFYELFLKEYDKKKKMQRGVFYTPKPVVSYIVRSVDELLRSEFGLEDGLADTTTWGEMVRRNPDFRLPTYTVADKDGQEIERPIDPQTPFVQILDPATGTATFLIEVIDVIHKTMMTKWRKEDRSTNEIADLWNDYVPKHLLPRLFGFELMMAPYTIAHMKVGLKLHETGYDFNSDERTRIFLTNSLEPPQEFSPYFLKVAPALAHEAQAVNEIKRNQRFTVVIGNPPYASISSNLSPTLRRTVDPYRSIDGQLIRERSMLQFEKNIQDDYIKFFAFSQIRLTEATQGICSLITNHSYLDGPTLRGMRWNLACCFQTAWYLDLHGNTNKRETAPGGIHDMNVFDIRQGVAISTFVKHSGLPMNSHFNLGEMWGDQNHKYKLLSALTVKQMEWSQYQITPPYYYFVTSDLDGFETEWNTWPSVCEVFTKHSTGTETGFDDLLVAFEKEELKKKIARFADPSISTENISKEFEISDGHAAKLFSNRKSLQYIRKDEIRLFQLRVFDYRWALIRKELLKTNSFNVMEDLQDESPGLVTTRQTKEAFSAYSVNTFCGHKITSSYDRSYIFPIFSKPKDSLLQQGTPNIEYTVREYFRKLVSYKEEGIDGERNLSLDIYRYVIATLNSPTYTHRFAHRLKRDWPRIPLPASSEIFSKLSHIGERLVSVYLMKSSILESPISTYEGSTNPVVEGVRWSDNTVWLDTRKSKKDQLTHSTTNSFHGVPEEVWNFQIGGYQVCEKWLKDRKGRRLSKEDITHYQKIVLAIQETIRLMGAIDAVIEAHGGWPVAFITEKIDLGEQETTVSLH